MGFFVPARGPRLRPKDRENIRELKELQQQVIIRTLNQAATKILQGKGKAESSLWFGDDRLEWMIELSSMLKMAALLIDTKPIRTWFADPNDQQHSNDFAIASEPAGGWQDFVGGQDTLTTALNRDFRIELDVLWYSAPMYRVRNNHDRKFQTLVHECTHLFFSTDDLDYSEDKCKDLADKAPILAKRNADCWGYFVEDFRTSPTALRLHR